MVHQPGGPQARYHVDHRVVEPSEDIGDALADDPGEGFLLEGGEGVGDDVSGTDAQAAEMLPHDRSIDVAAVASSSRVFFFFWERSETKRLGKTMSWS